LENETVKTSVELSDNPQLIQLFGSQDQNIRFIEESLPIVENNSLLRVKKKLFLK